jgi:hypothetical protein
MPTTDVPTKRAILYARVSTDEQARGGYSLAQQQEALREYAAREDYEILEEVQNPGQSGTSLERPGMDQVRDLVVAGGVSVVLAQDPVIGSPENQPITTSCGKSSKSTARSCERSTTAERTRRGMLRRVRDGNPNVTGRPRYGFRYNEAKTPTRSRVGDTGSGEDLPHGRGRAWAQRNTEPPHAHGGGQGAPVLLLRLQALTSGEEDGECAQGHIKAARVEDAVRRLFSSLLKDPDSIRLGMEEPIEQEREATHRDPKRDATPWEEKMAKCSRLRSAYQDQQAAGLMTLEELASKLAKLEEIRSVAAAER